MARYLVNFNMHKINSDDLSKIGAITIVGLVALFMFVFWIKGHKMHHYERFSFYFRNVNGLEEGAALRWNGLKIGVVEGIHAVEVNIDQDPFPAQALIDLGKRHLAKADKALASGKIEDLVLAREEINKAQLEITLGQASNLQSEITAGDFVEVEVVVTIPRVPIGPLNQVTIVPSGLIGEQYVDISTIQIDDSYQHHFDCSIPRFVVLEPVRLDSLIRVNAESAEAVTNLANRVNSIFGQDDADNVKKLIENLENLTKDFKIWKLF